MNLRLLRADPAYMMAKVSAIAGVVATLFSHFALDGRRFALERVALVLLVILPLACAAIMQPRRRAWPFQISLPIAASELARTRLHAIVLCWISPVLAIAAVAAIVRPDLGTDALYFMLSGTGCALVSAALHVGLWPERAILPKRGIGFACIVVSAVVIFSVRQLAFPSLAAVPFVVGLLALAWAFRRLPARFAHEDVLTPASTIEALDLGHYFALVLVRQRSTSSLARLVWGRWLRSPVLWFELLVAVLVGLMMFGRPLAALAMAITLGFMPARMLLASLKDLAHLPIARASHFRRLLIVSAAALFVAIGVVLIAPLPENGLGNRSGVRSRALVSEYDPELLAAPASVDVYRMAFGATAPTITAPNGDAFTPELLRVAAFVPLGLYDPYAWSPTSSPEFVAWQQARIVSDELAIWQVEGKAWTPAELMRATVASSSDDEWMRTAPATRGAPIGAAQVLLLVCMWGLGFWCGMPGAWERGSSWRSYMALLPFVVFVPLLLLANTNAEDGLGGNSSALAAWLGYCKHGLVHQVALWMPTSSALSGLIILGAFSTLVTLAWRSFRAAEMPQSIHLGHHV